MYHVEWLGEPQRVPRVLGSTDLSVGSLEEAMAEAAVLFEQVASADPYARGYRICKAGSPALITCWNGDFS